MRKGLNRRGLKGPLFRSGCRVTATHMSWAHVHAASTPATPDHFVRGISVRQHQSSSIQTNRNLADVGGTTGGMGEFLLGFAMACIGGYLITNQVRVVGSYWSFYGANTFGITLLPMLFGVGILFWNGRSTVGWLLTIGGALFIFA